jgi:hypothetical protein
MATGCRFFARLFRTKRVYRRKRDVELTRQLCLQLLADIPSQDRDSLELSLHKMRSPDDLPYVRAAFFNVVAQCHGESAARLRLTALDQGLQ